MNTDELEFYADMEIGEEEVSSQFAEQVIVGVQGPPGVEGKPGKDGYTPVKGVDYFDGKDGRDGVDGKDGSDGYTPVKGKDYFDGEPGKDGQDGQPGQPGLNGMDGVSPVVSITDIAGGYRITIQDVNGKKTVDVMDGSDGDTPERGVDYWTPDDIAEIKSYVDDAILGGAW